MIWWVRVRRQSLQTLAEQCEGVHVHGYVADAAPFWRHATPLAVPLLSGGGVRVKILEAMAMGLPVVSTTLGCEGLEVQNGVHLLIADIPEDFARACAKVLQDEELARRLAKNARQLILDRYDAKIALRPLDAAYERASGNEVLPGYIVEAEKSGHPQGDVSTIHARRV